MVDISKVTFPIGAILIFGSKIVNKFIVPLPDNVRTICSAAGLIILVSGLIISEIQKKNQKKID